MKLDTHGLPAWSETSIWIYLEWHLWFPDNLAGSPLRRSSTTQKARTTARELSIGRWCNPCWECSQSWGVGCVCSGIARRSFETSWNITKLRHVLIAKWFTHFDTAWMQVSYTRAYADSGEMEKAPNRNDALKALEDILIWGSPWIQPMSKGKVAMRAGGRF